MDRTLSLSQSFSHDLHSSAQIKSFKSILIIIVIIVINIILESFPDDCFCNSAAISCSQNVLNFPPFSITLPKQYNLVPRASRLSSFSEAIIFRISQTSSKLDQRKLVVKNQLWYLSQSETEKYFKEIIMIVISTGLKSCCLASQKSTCTSHQMTSTADTNIQIELLVIQKNGISVFLDSFTGSEEELKYQLK